MGSPGELGGLPPPDGKSCRRTADDDHFFMKSGPDRVDGNNIAALIGPVEVDRLDDEQLFSVEPFVLLRGHDRS